MSKSKAKTMAVPKGKVLERMSFEISSDNVQNIPITLIFNPPLSISGQKVTAVVGNKLNES